MMKYKDLLKNPDNKAYLDMSPKYALVNLTSKDIYEVGDKKSISTAGFKREWNSGDKVVILDVENDKVVKEIMTESVLSLKEEILLNIK